MMQRSNIDMTATGTTMNRFKFLVFLIMLVVPTTSRAGIISVSGDVQVIAPPPDVRINGLESDTVIFAFPELQNIVLTTAIAVNVSVPGQSTSANPNLSPATIPIGTRISSYFLHCDIISDDSPALLFNGSITFDSDVLGVIVLATQLNNSHSYPGLPTTQYSTIGELEFDGSNARDSFTLSANRRTISMTFRNGDRVDHMRVLTVAVPEPSSFALLAFCCSTLAHCRNRRRMVVNRTIIL
jgi:hypothetical protein